jgi:hypothetical protein
VSSAYACGRAGCISATSSRGPCRVRANSNGPRGSFCCTPPCDWTTAADPCSCKLLCRPYAHATMGSRAGQRRSTAARMRSPRRVLKSLCQSTCSVTIYITNTQEVATHSAAPSKSIHSSDQKCDMDRTSTSRHNITGKYLATLLHTFICRHAHASPEAGATGPSQHAPILLCFRHNILL